MPEHSRRQSKAQSATSDAVAGTLDGISTDYYVAWWMHDATAITGHLYDSAKHQLRRLEL